ncbi:MAG: fatty acid desaturase [Pseudomonadota bacterium]
MQAQREASLISTDTRAQLSARHRQTLIGVGLALAVMGAWLVCHIAAIFFIDWGALPLVAPLAMIALQTWLFVGLFIIAHDCMHGSLAPGRPAINRTFGRIALFLYAAFSYDKLLPEHHKHHRRPGTDADPDYNPDNPRAFWPWFGRFMSHYFGWREFAMIAALVVFYVIVLRPPVVNVVMFYALPAGLSALQLFYFGTYRPHRAQAGPFTDEHNTRTDDFPWFVSLLTCFHFGYHHEHHLSPTTPWWRLPAERDARRAATPVPAE